VSADQQDAQAAQVWVCRKRAARVGAGHHGGREGGARALFADCSDLASHGSGQAPDDRQPQSGAAEAAGRRSVGLGVGFEDAAQAVGRDADAGVAHLESAAQAAAMSSELKARVDVAALGELHGVAEQVGGDATPFDRIAEHRSRRVGLDQGGELDAFPGGLRLELRDRFLDQADGVEGDAFDLDGSLVVAGEFEDIADGLGQFLGAGPDLAQRRARIGFRGLEAGLAQALDGVERVTDLVRHVGGDRFGLGEPAPQAPELFRVIAGRTCFPSRAPHRAAPGCCRPEDEPGLSSVRGVAPQRDLDGPLSLARSGGAKDDPAAPRSAVAELPEEIRRRFAGLSSEKNPVETDAGPELPSDGAFDERMREHHFSFERTDHEGPTKELGRRARFCHGFTLGSRSRVTILHVLRRIP